MTVIWILAFLAGVALIVWGVETFAEHLGAAAVGLEYRPPLGPGARLFELRRQAEEGGLRAEAGGELHAHRQAVARPVQRHGHRRAAGGVEGRCEGDGAEDRLEIGVRVIAGLCEHADLVRRPAHRRRY